MTVAVVVDAVRDAVAAFALKLCGGETAIREQ